MGMSRVYYHSSASVQPSNPSLSTDGHGLPPALPVGVAELFKLAHCIRPLQYVVNVASLLALGCHTSLLDTVLAPGLSRSFQSTLQGFCQNMGNDVLLPMSTDY